jgi:hypothetical protein
MKFNIEIKTADSRALIGVETQSLDEIRVKSDVFTSSKSCNYNITLSTGLKVVLRSLQSPYIPNDIFGDILSKCLFARLIQEESHWDLNSNFELEQEVKDTYFRGFKDTISVSVTQYKGTTGYVTGMTNVEITVYPILTMTANVLFEANISGFSRTSRNLNTALAQVLSDFISTHVLFEAE